MDLVAVVLDRVQKPPQMVEALDQNYASVHLALWRMLVQKILDYRSTAVFPSSKHICKMQILPSFFVLLVFIVSVSYLVINFKKSKCRLLQ